MTKITTSQAAMTLFNCILETKQTTKEGIVEAEFYDIYFEREVQEINLETQKEIVSKLSSLLFEKFSISPDRGFKIQAAVESLLLGTHPWSRFIEDNEQDTEDIRKKHSLVAVRIIQTTMSGYFPETEVHEALYLRNPKSMCFEKKHSNLLYDSRKAKRFKN